MPLKKRKASPALAIPNSCRESSEPTRVISSEKMIGLLLIGCLTQIKAGVGSIPHRMLDNQTIEFMNLAIETMMSEHRLIEQVLLSLATFAEELEADHALPRESVAAYAAFFSEFADKCHHGKEEDHLFVQLTEAGFPGEHGPVGVMLAEHDEGREQVRALAEVGSGHGPLTAGEKQSVIAHARAFIPLLLAHIQKEDRMLYPMAMHRVPAAAMAQLEESCRIYDAEVMGAAEIQRLKNLAQQLLRQHPPQTGMLQQIQSCSFQGCH